MMRLGEKSMLVEFNSDEFWYLRKMVEHYRAQYPDDIIIPIEISRIYQELLRCDEALRSGKNVMTRCKKCNLGGNYNE